MATFYPGSFEQLAHDVGMGLQQGSREGYCGSCWSNHSPYPTVPAAAGLSPMFPPPDQGEGWYGVQSACNPFGETRSIVLGLGEEAWEEPYDEGSRVAAFECALEGWEPIGQPGAGWDIRELNPLFEDGFMVQYIEVVPGAAHNLSEKLGLPLRTILAWRSLAAGDPHWRPWHAARPAHERGFLSTGKGLGLGLGMAPGHQMGGMAAWASGPWNR